MESQIPEGFLPSSIFRQTENEYLDVIKMSPSSPETAVQASRLIEKLDIIWDRFRRGSYYSKNEDIDEYSTITIKFFLIPYYIGRLHMLFQGKDRPLHLEAAVAYFNAFSDQMTHFRIVDKEKPRANNPTERRERAIAELKDKKELEKRLERMNSLIKDDDYRGAIGERVDEETERDLVKDLLKLSVIEARSMSRAATDEIPFATMHSEGIKPEEPKAPPPKLWFKRIDREQARKSVFAPLEDVMPRELPPDDETFASPGRPSPKLDASDEEERELARIDAAKWDDWKDDHPPFSQE